MTAPFADLPARYGLTGEWGGNFIAGADEARRFDEYPRYVSSACTSFWCSLDEAVPIDTLPTLPPATLATQVEETAAA